MYRRNSMSGDKELKTAAGGSGVTTDQSTAAAENTVEQNILPQQPAAAPATASATNPVEKAPADDPAAAHVASADDGAAAEVPADGAKAEVTADDAAAEIPVDGATDDSEASATGAGATTTTTAEAGHVNVAPQRGIEHIWDVLVRLYRKNKPHDARELPNVEQPSKHAGRAQNVAMGASLLAGAMNTTASGLGYKNAQEIDKMGKEYDPENPPKDVKNRANAAGWLRVASGGTMMLSSTLGTLASISRYRTAKKNKQRNKKGQAVFDTIAGATGFAASTLSTASAITNVANGNARNAGIVGLTGSSLAGLLSVMKTGRAIKNYGHHKMVASGAGGMYKRKKDGSQRNRNDDVETLTQRAASRDGSGNKDAERAAAKARLFAMKQAEEYSKSKASQEGRNAAIEGLVGLGSSLAGIAGGVVSFLGGSGKTSGILGMGASLGKMLGTGLSKGNQKKAAQANNQRMHAVVDEYLRNKKAKVLEYARSVVDNEEDDPQKLNSEELRMVEDDEGLQAKIAIARLGIEVTHDNQGIDETLYKRMFKEITFRRAQNILNADQASRDEMLGALRLPTTASIEEIAEALGYEG